jgi:DNA-binding MarR family transcriptional regulator
MEERRGVFNPHVALLSPTPAPIAVHPPSALASGSTAHYLGYQDTRRSRGCQPVPTSAQLEEVHRLLRHFSTHRSRWILALCRHVGITRSDYDAFEALHEEGPMTPGELATFLSLTSGTVTALIDRFEALGWAKREEHPDDRRSVIVTLTPKAWRTRQAELEPYLQAVNKATTLLAPDELDAVIRFLEAAIKQVSQAARPD